MNLSDIKTISVKSEKARRKQQRTRSALRSIASILTRMTSRTRANINFGSSLVAAISITSFMAHAYA